LKHLVLALAAASALLATGSAARGEDAFEIQVYDSEIDKPLEPSLEFHLNYVARGRRDEDYHREVTPDQLVHMTLEPALGVTDFLELGGYLQFAWDPRGVGGGTAYFGGWKLRAKLVVPRETSGIFDLGLNFEFSRVPHHFEESESGVELRPILGVRYAGFQFNVNPIFSWGLSEDRAGVPDFEPCVKASWDTTLGFSLGVEYYTGLGRIDHIPALEEQHHTIYVVFDLVEAPIELDLGVGRGLTPDSNAWTVKMIIGKSF